MIIPRKMKSIYKQTGKTNILNDSARKALLPGYRISKNGKVYYEARKNRSDAYKKTV